MVKKFAQFQVSEFQNPLNRLMDNDPEFYKKFPVFGAYYNYFTGETQKIKDFFYEQIRIHREAIDFEADEEPSDFVEAYLRHQYKLDKDGVKDHTYE